LKLTLCFFGRPWHDSFQPRLAINPQTASRETPQPKQMRQRTYFAHQVADTRDMQQLLELDEVKRFNAKTPSKVDLSTPL